MRKLILLLAVGSLWLFLAAIPAFADGGPHVAATNSGVSTLTADSCAGCHRAHTAQGSFLINKASEEDLCLGCHGTASTGATTSVMDGIQYALASGLRDKSTIIGALRGGGFTNARIGGVGRLATTTSTTAPTVTTGFKTKVTVGASAPVTSSHIAMTGTVDEPGNGLSNPHVAWGNGPVDSSTNGNAGAPNVSLSCVDCHNPHGNNQYRILNPVPAPDGVTAMGQLPVDMEVIDTVGDVIYTKTGHPFMQGDLVTIAGAGSLNGNWVVWAVPNGITIQIAALATGPTTGGLADLTPFNITGTPTLGTIVRTSAPVADSPMGTPDIAGVYPLKNYTVYQTKVTQATGAGGTFFASQIPANSATKGDYWHRQIPWDAASGSTQDGPNGRPAMAVTRNEVAFNQQMTAWCSSCHSRYFAYQNPNPTGKAPSDEFFDRHVAAASSGDTITVVGEILPGGTSAITSTGLSLGDKVTIAGTDPVAGSKYVVFVSALTFKVSDTLGGAPITFTSFTTDAAISLVAPGRASAWYLPRLNSAGAQDTIFKYQHSTRADRVCTTCHVSHGTNRVMTGPFSANYARPDGVKTDDSRLLKVDNRGTCQGCHDPTGPSTATAVWATTVGKVVGTYQGDPAGITGGTPNGNTPPQYTGGIPVVP